MDFEVTAATLGTFLRRANGVVRHNATMPLLGSVFLEATSGKVTFTAYDGEVAIISEAPSSVHKPGTGLLPHSAFPYLLTLKGDVRLARGFDRGSYLEAKSGDGKKSSQQARFGESGLPDDFPRVPREAGDFHALNAAALAEQLSRVSYAVSRDASRPMVCGAYLEASASEAGRFRMVATDGVRLASLNRKLGDFTLPGGGVLIPLTGAVKLQQLLQEDSVGWELACTTEVLVVRKPGLCVVTRLLQHTFPEYERVVPKYKSSVRIPHEAVRQALARVAIVDDVFHMDFTEDGTLRLKAASAKVGEAEDDVELPARGATSRRTAFKVKQLEEALAGARRPGASPAEEYVLVAFEKDEPLLLRTPGNEDCYLALVMPMRV